MRMRTLGMTGLQVSEMGFGALPIQRTDETEAVRILRRAYEAGITFYDTARAYSDSEKKLGLALSDVRKDIFIATKTQAASLEKLKGDLETSLKTLKTDYIDVYQFHNPAYNFDNDEALRMHEYVSQMKKQGVIKHIGVTAHKYGQALDHIATGLFQTLQYPISLLSSEKDFEVINAARKSNLGIIAMKGLSGGLLTNARAACGWMMTQEDIEPIWGIQHMHELEEFLALYQNGVTLDDELKAIIEKERAELTGAFCRGCGYCLPCAAGIPINMYARLPYMIRRMPESRHFTEEFAAQVEKINDCIDCGACHKRCPYELDCPSLMREALKDYHTLYAEHKAKLAK